MRKAGSDPPNWRCYYDPKDTQLGRYACTGLPVPVTFLCIMYGALAGRLLHYYMQYTVVNGHKLTTGKNPL